MIAIYVELIDSIETVKEGSKSNLKVKCHMNDIQISKLLNELIVHYGEDYIRNFLND